MHIQAKLTPNYLMTTKQSSMSGITPAPSSPTAEEAPLSVSTKALTPAVKTASWGQRVQYRTTRSLSALDDCGAAKATKKSAASLAARKQLMNDLLNPKELFLKTSYGHSPQKLHLAAKMLKELLNQPHKDLTALRLLTKYIESDFKRVEESVSSSLKATKARQAAGRALSRLGKYLTAEVPRTAGSNPAMMTLTETWINALIESMRRQPAAGHFTANFATVDGLMRFLLTDSSRRMGDYAFYRCFSLLCDLFSYVPNSSDDSRYLYHKQTQLLPLLSQTIQESLALASASPQGNFALDHLRRAMTAFTVMANNEKAYRPESHLALLAQRDQKLAEWVRPYQALPAQCSLREDIRGVLVKYVEDTGRHPDSYPAYAFHGLFKPVRESEFLPYATPLPFGGRILSQHRIDPATQQRLNASLQRLLDTFHPLFGHTPVADDLSRPLEIIVLSDRARYERYGHYPFRIDTNNGGIYIEGQPQDARNQPRIYVYCREGEIVNFLHEIVHYLDGKYIRYGDSAYLSPERITFWQEGLAESLCGKNRALAARTLQRCPVDLRPSLDEIVDIDTYSANGHAERIYVWTYYVFEYLNSSAAGRSILVALAAALRQPDHGAGFTPLLTDFVREHAGAFKTWLNKQAEVAAAA